MNWQMILKLGVNELIYFAFGSDDDSIFLVLIGSTPKPLGTIYIVCSIKV